MRFNEIKKILLGAAVVATLMHSQAQALELDWSGQFWSEYNWIYDYAMDNNALDFDATRAAAGGYYIPSTSSKNASFQTLFLRLKPKLVVNDNIFIKSEWWLGDPAYSLFGDAAPYPNSNRFFNSTLSRGATVSAQRLWGEFLTDIGTVQVGRMPLHWGLGIVWNSGDALWDRYASTGDALRMVSKFGAFSFTPSLISYSMGNAVGGACIYDASTGQCVPQSSTGSVLEYSLSLKYENPDEDFEGGVNFIRRLAGISQDPTLGYLGPPGNTVSSRGVKMNYNIWDIYGRKRLGKYQLALEAPIVSGGKLGGGDYSTFALATEASAKFTDSWEGALKVGYAPGQENQATQDAGTFKAFYFHPAYRPGMILFNYQLANFAGSNNQNDPRISPTNIRSPFDHPIVDAIYAVVGGTFRTDKWQFGVTEVYARARETAAAGLYFWNNDQRRFVLANADQTGNTLGWETDLSATFHWDDTFQFRLDGGLLFPGAYYKFANLAGQENQTSIVFATAARVGVAF